MPSEKNIPVFVAVIAAIAIAVTPVFAQTLPSYDGIYYSPEKYPTAQGKYLQLPPGYQELAAPEPEAVLSSPPPAPLQYGTPSPTSSGIDVRPPHPVTIYPQAPGVYEGQSPAASPSDIDVRPIQPVVTYP